MIPVSFQLQRLKLLKGFSDKNLQLQEMSSQGGKEKKNWVQHSSTHFCEAEKLQNDQRAFVVHSQCLHSALLSVFIFLSLGSAKIIMDNQKAQILVK